MTDITVTITKDEVQYLVDSIDTHIKTHGLKVAMGGVVILGKLQASVNGQGVNEADPSDP